MTEATVIVHWPGKDTPACNNHAVKLENLAKFMGFIVSTTPAQLQIPCTNCENEERKTK